MNHQKKIIRIISAGILFALALILNPQNQTLRLGLYLLSYAVIGGDVLLRALKNIFRGRVFDENFLMSLATIGAFCIGEYPEGVAVMLFYQVGELFESYAVERSRQSIASLMDIRPDYANVQRGTELLKIDPEEVAVGERIVIKSGEKIPLDGRVLEGSSLIDTSALTGESLPRSAGVGDEILSGCINLNGLLTAEVTKAYGESTVSKILDLVENASSKKSRSETFITKFARVYTPAVVTIAALLAFLPPLILPGATFSEWISRALVFLVVSCPCALVISVPLSFFGGIGGASRSGILVKGGNYLEALAQTEIVVFDKTGTLTRGVFDVQQVSPQGMSAECLLEWTAHAESYSNHPISGSLKRAYGKEIDRQRVTDVEEISGHGVCARVDGKMVLAGNPKLMKLHEIPCDGHGLVGTVVHTAVDGSYAGCVVIADEIKEDAPQAIRALKKAHVRRTVMLTGDTHEVGNQVARTLGVDEVFTELLPADKVEKLEMLFEQKSARGKLVFVGDGINDAPVLARADIGIAMGGLGSDAAIEAADVVIMTDEPSKVAEAIAISRRTLRIVKQNIIFALSVKGIVLLMGAAGMATMWEAVFADVGVAVLAILNAMRMLDVKRASSPAND